MVRGEGVDESRGTELDSTPGPVAEARTANGTGQKDPVREHSPGSLFSLFRPKYELSKS
jgi:hypothetical protein